MSIIQTLTEQFPVRKTKAQKQAFREWAVKTCTDMGYCAAADTQGFSRNIVIGTPETAQVIFTAHYDTPPRMFFPNFCTPTRPCLFYLIQIGMGLGIVAAAAAVGLLTGVATGSLNVGFVFGYVLLWILLLLMMFGPANPNCVNDNTSGVAAILELMNKIPPQQREKAAFILFDNEEKGLLGSAAYASKHKQIKKNTPVINLDCVGDGENILFIAAKAFRALPCFPRLTEAMEQQSGRNYLMKPKEKCVYPSDQANFNLSIGVCACSHSPRLGYYFSRIHTPKDTVCEQINLDFLSAGLAAFIDRL